FYPTCVPLHITSRTMRSLAAVFLYLLWNDQILSGTLGGPQSNLFTSSAHLLGTVALGIRPFSRRTILGDISCKDSGGCKI
ncbi:hypothetical protein B0H14DRAFT_2751275, partial [Mycena olivaceomarginata]